MNNNLPRVISFDNLHLTKNLKAAKKTLKGLAGIYGIVCTVTNTKYIGSTTNIGDRLVDHVVDGNSNEHLQNAITKHGLENFVFVVVELFEVEPNISPEGAKAQLLEREQFYLDWLFSLPVEFRYNFLPTAGSSFRIFTHRRNTYKN